MMRRASGFSLVSAIFLMVVLVVLGGSIVTLSSVQHSSTALRVQSVKAHYAARAGLEWGISVIRSGGCTGTNSFTLGQMSVSVDCANTVHDLEGVLTNYFVLTSTATDGVYGGTDYVSRRLEAKVIQ